MFIFSAASKGSCSMHSRCLPLSWYHLCNGGERFHRPTPLCFLTWPAWGRAKLQGSDYSAARTSVLWFNNTWTWLQQMLQSLVSSQPIQSSAPLQALTEARQTWTIQVLLIYITRFCSARAILLRMSYLRQPRQVTATNSPILSPLTGSSVRVRRGNPNFEDHPTGSWEVDNPISTWVPRYTSWSHTFWSASPVRLTICLAYRYGTSRIVLRASGWKMCVRMLPSRRSRRACSPKPSQQIRHPYNES